MNGFLLNAFFVINLCIYSKLSIWIKERIGMGTQKSKDKFEYC